MDLHDQQVYMQNTGQWRYTPPTHVVAALSEMGVSRLAPRLSLGHGRPDLRS